MSCDLCGQKKIVPGAKRVGAADRSANAWIRHCWAVTFGTGIE